MFAHWPDLDLGDEFPHTYAMLYEAAFMRRPLRDDEPFAVWVDSLSEKDVAQFVDGSRDPARPLSRHLELAVATVHHRGWKEGEPSPLVPGAPVPGCNCPDCTGLPADHPVRVVPLRTRHRRAAYRRPLDVDAARAVPILDVARRLRLEIDPRGKVWARCPFHEDHDPSLHLNPKKQRAFCNPCGRSWDGIALWAEYNHCTFADAVQALAT